MKITGAVRDNNYKDYTAFAITLGQSALRRAADAMQSALGKERYVSIKARVIVVAEFSIMMVLLFILVCFRTAVEDANSLDEFLRGMEMG